MKKTRKHTGTLQSPRLQKVLKAMKRGGWWTPFKLIVTAKVTNPGECVSALRFNGVKIEKRNVPGEHYCEWRIAK